MCPTAAHVQSPSVSLSYIGQLVTFSDQSTAPGHLRQRDGVVEIPREEHVAWILLDRELAEPDRMPDGRCERLVPHRPDDADAHPVRQP